MTYKEALIEITELRKQISGLKLRQTKSCTHYPKILPSSLAYICPKCDKPCSPEISSSDVVHCFSCIRSYDLWYEAPRIEAVPKQPESRSAFENMIYIPLNSDKAK